MPKKCLVINLDRCTGCDSCIVSCKFENSLPLGVYYNRVLAGGLAVRLLMWLFSEGFMELFKAARVVLNC